MSKHKRRFVEDDTLAEYKTPDYPKLINADKIPRCQICGKPMVNTVDSKTGKISKYLWKTTCSHAKNLRLSIG